MLEVAEICRRHSAAYCAQQLLRPSQQRALRDIQACRTAYFGGHLKQCDHCGRQIYAYHSCRNRHCPKCHGDQTEHWLAQQQTRLLPCPYFLVTFTLPAELRPLAFPNQKEVYGLLLRSASAALQKLALDPQYLGGRLGALAVLHTWTRAMLYHPHVHMLVTGGGLSADGKEWRPAKQATYLMPSEYHHHGGNSCPTALNFLMKAFATRVHALIGIERVDFIHDGLLSDEKESVANVSRSRVVVVTIARSSLLIPFPDFGTINTTNNDGKTWYNSGQFSLQKRFSKGYGLQFAYTRSKWTQQTEYLNAADPTPTKMISDQDVPNWFSMSAFYAFPFGKGQRFGSNANKLVNAVIGGWQIEGTYVYQSGFPVQFASDAFYLGGTISIPNSQRTLTHWFNTDAFVNVLGATLPTCQSAPTGSANCATPVNHLRTLPLRFADVRTDPINNADLGLRKDIRLNETMKVQLRMEFLNAFNHPLLNGLSLMPVVDASSATFGQVTASNLQNYARRAQLSAKFIF